MKIDDVDELLVRAGAQWRADEPSAPEPDLDRITGARQRPRRWVPALAAASVVAVAAATLSILPNGGTAAPQTAQAPAPTPEAVESVANGNQPTGSNDDLLVRDGTKVRVSGEVIAAPNVPPVFCPSRPIPLIGHMPGKAPAPTCPDGLKVSLQGVDVSRLTDLATIQGVRTGRATLTGIWTGRTIAVQQQAAPTPERDFVTPPLPCPPPKGGWPVKPSNIEDPKVAKFLDQHRDQAFGPVIYRPYGDGRTKPVVVFVGVAHGDRAAFRRAFEEVYDGNLCLAPARLSQGDAEQLSGKVAGLMNRDALGITTSYTQMDGASENVRLLVYTDAVKAALAPIGLDNLRIEPAVVPVR
ncbi:hypothetical protein GCM10029976_081880 [Kribbella albertanoniae]|uniref:Uncharacterized protein n=1 Tax=Kribbella albertanoniae TaxID=1266829 RepID=A0A4R4P8J6_9ACTN|nr:hypothetical protein [Kribbella albertanoniae]TDC17167.1 hypothetical protein E1261_37590 [Kribbella albertanoniae]